MALLHEDRLFPAEEGTRAIARRLYAGIRELPLVSPHGHTQAGWFAQQPAVSRSCGAVCPAGSLRLPHAVQPGNHHGGAGDWAAGRLRIRARSGASSPATITSSAERRRGCGSTMPSRSFSA